MATPTEELTERIDTLRTDATRLLDTAQHKTMKDQVRLAIRDLDEAVVWIQQKDFDGRPPIVLIVRFILETVMRRLEMVEGALKSYGPGAMLVW